MGRRSGQPDNHYAEYTKHLPFTFVGICYVWQFSKRALLVYSPAFTHSDNSKGL